MTTADHRAMARRYLRTSQMLRERDALIEAGEIIWGALVHALNAMAHSRQRRHRSNNRSRREFLQAMIDANALDESDMLAFMTSGLALHERFYRARLEDAALASDLNVARALVERLLTRESVGAA